MKKISKLKSLLNNLCETNNKSHEEIQSDIIDFFKKNPNPSDDKVHDFAIELGLDPDELEEYIYAVLTDLVSESYEPKDDSEEEQMKSGIDIESEHLNTIIELIKDLGGDPNSEIGKQLIEKTIKGIANDHIREIKNYYTRLVVMEKEAEK